ncbi:MAG: thiamine pyrophosphate-binding protein [Bauldia sp.]
MNVADYVVAFLAAMGVKHVYGYPGSPLVPLLAAFERQDRVRFVLMRHENAAAMAAGAHGRISGDLGVCIATSGPGALNALCGVVDSDLDRVPVLALTGSVPTAQEGHWEFQDVSQAQLYRAVLAHSAAATHPHQLVALLRNFVGVARQEQRAVHLSLPSDLLATGIAPDDRVFQIDAAHQPRHLRLMPPPMAAVEIVAEEIENYRLPVIVLGRRALGCGVAIEMLAEKLGAPIITSLDGKGIIDESHPNLLGVLGIFGFPALETTQKILRQADLVLAMGIDTIKPFLTDELDVQRRALIQCEPEAGFLTHEYHRDRTLVGPLDAIADALCENLRQRAPHEVIAALAAERAAFRRTLAAPAATTPGGFIHPRDFLLALSEVLPEDATLVFDTGANTLWAAQYLQLTKRQRVIVSSHLGTMGFALPAAIAIQHARPGKPVIAICGDGGFQMTVAELAVAVQEQLPIVIIVFNNGVLQNVMAQQAVPYGTTLVNPDFVALARAYGADGAVVEEDVSAVFAEALAAGRTRPFLIDLPVGGRVRFRISKWEHYAPPN